jgi:hypothetical protein
MRAGKAEHLTLCGLESTERLTLGGLEKTEQLSLCGLERTVRTSTTYFSRRPPGRDVKDLLQADWTRHKGLTSGGLDEA